MFGKLASGSNLVQKIYVEVIVIMTSTIASCVINILLFVHFVCCICQACIIIL